jgi:hypothetical protein
MGIILRGMLVLLLDPSAVHQAGALAVVRATVHGGGSVSFAGLCLLSVAFWMSHTIEKQACEQRHLSQEGCTRVCHRDSRV